MRDSFWGGNRCPTRAYTDVGRHVGLQSSPAKPSQDACHSQERMDARTEVKTDVADLQTDEAGSGVSPSWWAK